MICPKIQYKFVKTNEKRYKLTEKKVRFGISSKEVLFEGRPKISLIIFLIFLS